MWQLMDRMDNMLVLMRIQRGGSVPDVNFLLDTLHSPEPPDQVLFRIREQSPDDQVRLRWKTTMQFPWWVNLMIREARSFSG